MEDPRFILYGDDFVAYDGRKTELKHLIQAVLLIPITLSILKAQRLG